MRPLSLFLAAGLFLSLSTACAATGEEKSSAAGEKETQAKDAKKKAAPAAQKPGQAPLYTNDDLERMFGSSTAPQDEADEPAGGEVTEKTEPPKKEQPKKPAAAPSDPLKAMEDAEARQADLKLRMTDAERAVAEASARVRELEKRLLAIRNPFLARPQLPPEEAEAWKNLDSEERLKRTEKQLEEARARLASLGSGS